MVLRGEELQRVVGEEVGVATRTLAGSNVDGNPWLTHAFELVRGEVGASRRCVELAVAERATVVGIRGADPADAAQLVVVDRRQRRPQQRVVVVEQRRLGVAHGSAEASEHLGVRARFARGFDRRGVPADPQVTPGEHDVVALDLRGGREHDVGVASGVGDELLVDDGEQVVTLHAPPDEFGLRHGHQRVAVPVDNACTPGPVVSPAWAW